MPPIPRPARNRKTENTVGDGAKPHRAVDALNSTTAVSRMRLRPNRSASTPNPTAPSIIPKKPYEPMAPASTGVMPHCLISTGSTAP